MAANGAELCRMWGLSTLSLNRITIVDLRPSAQLYCVSTASGNTLLAVIVLDNAL